MHAIRQREVLSFIYSFLISQLLWPLKILAKEFNLAIGKYHSYGWYRMFFCKVRLRAVGRGAGRRPQGEVGGQRRGAGRAGLDGRAAGRVLAADEDERA